MHRLDPHVINATEHLCHGQALRTAAVDSFEQVLGSSQFTLGSVSGTRRSGASRNNPVMPLTDKFVAGVELTFVINAGVAVDINSLNAAMTSTGTSGFAQVFYTKATAAGQVVSMPTVTVCALLVRAVSFAAPLTVYAAVCQMVLFCFE